MFFAFPLLNAFRYIISFETLISVFENGIILTGGGSEIFGLETMMSKVFGISVTKPTSPIDCVSKGLSRINTFLPVKNHSNGKNITDQLGKFYETKKQNKK